MFDRKMIILVDCESDLAKLKQSELRWHFNLSFESSSDWAKILKSVSIGNPPFILINDPEDKPDLISQLKKACPEACVIGRTDSKSEESLISIISSGIDFILPASSSPRLIFSVIAAKATTNDEQDESLVVENLVLNQSSRSAFLEGKRIKLSDLEFRLLFLFASNLNKILKRDFILKQVWGSQDVISRTVDSHIVGLRKKLEGFPLLFDSIYGVGYILRGKEFS